MALPQSYVTVSRRPPDVEDYIDMLRRRRSWIIGPMFLGLVASTVVAFLWPDTFVSKAVLRITPQQVSERLVPAEFNTQMTQRLNEMEQSILSRTTLEGIITDPALDLYKRDRVTRTMEDIVSDMRTHDIDIRPIQVPGSPGADSNRQIATAFSISFSYQDRYKAQAVVRALVSKFVDQNQQVQRDNAHLTTSFLEDELKVAQARLVALDDQITKFKMANNGKLPEELTSNTNMLNSSLLQQSQIAQSLQNAIDRKSMYETTLQGQLSQLDYLKANAEETVSPQQSAQAQVQNQALAAATARVQELNERLAGIRQTLGAKAPEVRMLTAQIQSAQLTKDNLEKQQQQKKESETAAQPAAPADKRVRNKNAEAAMVNLQAQIEQTKTMINEAAGNIKLLQTEQEDIGKRIAAYEARIQ